MKIWVEELSDWQILPVFKAQMVYLLARWYPADIAKFKRMGCKQLRAIICSYTRRQAKVEREA